MKFLHRTGPVPVAYIVQRLREDKSRYPLLQSYHQIYVKGATSGKCFENNEKIWAEVARRLEVFKKANPEATDEEAENVVEAESVEILQLVLGKRKGNEVRGMGRAGKLVASKDSGSGSSRRRRGSSSAAETQSEIPPAEWQARYDRQEAVIKKQKSKLSKIGKKMKCLACLIPKILSATGVEHEGIQEVFRDDDDEEDDDEDDDDDVAVDISAEFSQVGPAHSRPSASGGIVMIPTPGLQTTRPPPSGKGKGKADY